MHIIVLATLLSAAAAADSTVYIIRHGEKTFSSGCLDIQGQERANNMPNVFGGVAFAAPSAIFANKYDGPPNCERCWLTVQTLAQHLSLRVEFDYGYPDALGGNEAAADAIRAAARNHSVVLVSWEHYNIQFLTEDLGVDASDVPEWGDDDYDTIYELTLDADSGGLLAFEVKAQGYTPQSTTCPPDYVPPVAPPAPQA